MDSWDGGWDFNIDGGGDGGGGGGYDPGTVAGNGADMGPPQFSIDPNTGLMADAQGNLYDPNTGMPVGNSSGGMPPGMDSGGSSGIGSSLAQFAKMMGLSPSMLMPLLAGLGGSIYGINQQKKATNQMQDALTNSNNIITSTLGNNQDLYKPYQQAGTDALAKMQAFPTSNIAANFPSLAGNYNPLGSGRGLKLSQISGGK